MRVLPLLLVTRMKTRRRWIHRKHSNLELKKASRQDTCSSGCGQSGNEGDNNSENFMSTSSITNADDHDSEPQGNSVVGGVIRTSDTDLSLQCTYLGCSDFSIPHHPLELPQSRVAVSYSSKQGNSSKTKQYCRSIQPSWYKKYSWITVCTIKHKIFCRVCSFAKQQKLLSPSVLRSSPFTAEGFSSWNKALERFDMHEKSQMHREAIERLTCKDSIADIGIMMNTRSSIEQEFHRNMLFKLMRAVRFLGTQGLPLRGHNESAAREICINFCCCKQKNALA